MRILKGIGMFCCTYLPILFLFKLFSVAFTANDGTPDCLEEWHSFNGSCFKYFARNATVMLARQYCWELGGGADLASIHSAEENGFVQNLVNGANSTGGNGFIIGLMFDPDRNAFWSDDSPVDFGSPDGQPPGTYPWFLNKTAGFWWPSQPDNAWGIEHCTFLTSIDYTWGDWNCFTYQPGFLCRKSPASDPVVPRVQLKTVDMAALWPHPAFSFFSILIQFYLIWLIIMRSPTGMRNYRHFLCASTASDIAVTFIIGFLIVPDNWMPREIGATVQGLGKLFGQHGGQITLSMAIYAVSCQIGFQLISLIYRFACIMDREWPKFSSKMSKPLAHKIMFLWVFSNSAMLAFLTKDVSINPEETAGVQPADWSSLKFVSDLLLAKAPFILLNIPVLTNVFAKIVFTLMLVQGIGIFLTGRIICYLRVNAKHFTAHTYKLQLQLMVSLLVQLILPCLFVGLPMLILLFFAILFINFEEKSRTLFPGKSATDFGIFFIEFYALLNPLTIIFFVTSYRRHFAKISGISRLSRMLANAVHGQSSANHETAGVQPADWSSLKFVSDLLLAKAPFILLNIPVLTNVFAKIVFTLMLVQGIGIFLTGRIICYLRVNAKHFTAHTYKLQLQLMVSLLVQLILPCLFVGLPMLILLFFAILFINFEEKSRTLFPGKSATDFGIFFIEFYALLNPLTIIFFVTSYRRHFAKISGISRLSRMLANAVHGQSSANHVSPAGGHISINQMHIQTTCVEEIIANKVPRPL